MDNPQVGKVEWAPDYESEKGSPTDFLQNLRVTDKRGQVKTEHTPPPPEQPETPLVAREYVPQDTLAAIGVLEGKLEVGDKFWHFDVQYVVVEVARDHIKIAVNDLSKQAVKRMKRAIARRH